MPTPHDTPGIADSLRLFAAGNAAAREQIADLCGMRILALANRMLSAFPGGGQCAADDEAIETTMRRFRAVLTALGRASPRLTLALAAAALKRVILALAARRLDSLNLASGCGLSPAPDAIQSRWLVFFQSVDALPPLQREVFHLVWFMGADPAAVSLLTGRSRQTVRRCWREARTTVADVVSHDAANDLPDDSGSFVAVA